MTRRIAETILLGTLLALGGAAQANQWVTGHTIGVPAFASNGPNGTGTPVYINTTDAHYTPAANTWIRTDVTQYGVPADAIGVYLGGTLNITNGSEAGIANQTIAFRAPGDTKTLCGSYVGQVIAVNPPGGEGARAPMGAWAPVVGGKIEWCWARGIMFTEYPGNAIPAYPQGPAYGVNLTLEAYVEP